MPLAPRNSNRPAKPTSLRFQVLSLLGVIVVATLWSASSVTQYRAREQHDNRELARLRQLGRELANQSAQTLRAHLEPHRPELWLPSPASIRALESVWRTRIALNAEIAAVELFIREPTATGERQPTWTRLADIGRTPDAPPPQVSTLGAPAPLEVDDSGLVAIDQAIVALDRLESGRMHKVLRIWARPSPWTQDFDWRTPTAFAIGLGFVVFTLGTALLEVAVLGPLAALARGLSQLGEGEQNVELTPAGPLEVRAIVEGFNAMSRALAQQREQLAGQAQTIERGRRLAALGRLSAGLAHEIGNPLSAMLGYTQLLSDPRSASMPEDDRRALLQRIGDQIERIQRLVGELTDFALPRALQNRNFAVADVVDGIFSLLRGDPKLRGVEFRAHIEGPSTMIGDRDGVERILMNLVLNAAKASLKNAGSAVDGRQGQVDVHISAISKGSETQPDSWLCIDVEDDGEGVPSELRDRIFDPFFTTSEPGAGTGLGLSICAELCHAMAGSIELLDGPETGEHRHRHQGARFRLELPRQPPQAEAEAEAEAKRLPSAR